MMEKGITVEISCMMVRYLDHREGIEVLLFQRKQHFMSNYLPCTNSIKVQGVPKKARKVFLSISVITKLYKFVLYLFKALLSEFYLLYSVVNMFSLNS